MLNESCNFINSHPFNESVGSTPNSPACNEGFSGALNSFPFDEVIANTLLDSPACNTDIASAFNSPAYHMMDRLIGLVVRRPLRERKIPGSNPACAQIFSGSSHTSDLKLALQWLPCQAPGVIGSVLGLVGPVSVNLWLGEMESLICNFYLSVAARQIVWADPSLRYTCMLLGR